MKLFWLMVAGAVGAATRYGLTLLIQGWLSGKGSRSPLAANLGATFPLGTLLINVTGAFVLSLITTLALRDVIKPDLRIILGTGFVGAYTTFSTFELEAEGLISHGAWTPASAYIFGNLILGYFGILLGRAAAMAL